MKWNAIGVKVPSPVNRYLIGVDQGQILGEGNERTKAIRQLEPVMREVVEGKARRDTERKEAREARRKAEEEEEEDGNEEGEDGDEEEQSESESESESESDLDEEMEFDWSESTANGPLSFTSGLFKACSGSAVFPLLSTINHSCAPNCEVTYIEDNHVVVFASRPIQPGEQLHIAYVNTDMESIERRTALLEDYGFDCTCNRCVAELKAAEAVAEVKRIAAEAKRKGRVKGTRRKPSGSPAVSLVSASARKKTRLEV
jgi:hypothetical protein